MEKRIKLIDLWYLDGNYNKPVKTMGFKNLVKTDKWYEEREGYVFIEPESKAFMIEKNKGSVFESEKDANYHLEKQLSEHKTFVEKQIKYYLEELKKCETKKD